MGTKSGVRTGDTEDYGAAPFSGHRGGGFDTMGNGAAPYTKISGHRGGGCVKLDTEVV